jgi:hypothetical protein
VTDRPDLDAIETAWYNDTRVSPETDGAIPSLLDYIGSLEAALAAARAREQQLTRAGNKLAEHLAELMVGIVDLGEDGITEALAGWKEICGAAE